MVTIAINDENRKRLLAIAADLQKKSGKKINFDDVISYLAKVYEQDFRRPELFEQFCQPIAGVSFETLYAELIMERKRDEQRTGTTR
jgi:hypothetical protein